MSQDFTLTTPRLLLRTHTPADFAACVTLWSSPEVTRFIGGRPSSSEEVWRRILTYAGLWQLCGYGYLLVTDRQTGGLVGECGLADFQREITPAFGNTPEAGWAILPQFQGRGLAYEAVEAVLRWADASLPKTVCMIDPQNAASLRLAARLGYSDYATTTYKGNETILLERNCPNDSSPRS